ncbi:response regulator [Tengunoibacter tsumagoiensis]|nr:response regulator [Tengunoibacter tsumagoiensis]
MNGQEQKIVLIVEDDEAIGEVMSIAITQETSYRPLLVASGAEARQVLKMHKPCLIVLDYILSDINGLDLYDQLLAEGALVEIDVLLVSAGMHDEEAEKRGIALLEKPFDLDDFIHHVESSCSSFAMCH